MATLTVTPTQTFVSGNTVTPATLNQLAQSTVALTAGTIVDADVSASAAIALSKLATGALPAAITVASANLVDGTIVNADINATAAIAGSKLADAGITAAKLDGAQTGSAPIYGCRAWVNFDGTTVTNVGGEDRCTIRANGNVSKVVRTATGRYTVHFTTAMSDNNYALFLTAKDDDPAVSGWTPFINSGSYETVLTTAAAKVVSYNVVSGPRDTSVVCVQVFR